MKILYAFFGGMMMSGVYCITLRFNGLDGADPEVILWGIALTFLTGFIIGLFAYNRKIKRKEEEEERQAEQDRTNELMREYLEKKLREEEKLRN